ncbi:MAG: hypothetical protein OFPI_18130 [Osedax symbiont Rs2]|nr:MAG: hypothetical protein OFPI_18130 [Osedax symbiont Rs2]
MGISILVRLFSDNIGKKYSDRGTDFIYSCRGSLCDTLTRLDLDTGKAQLKGHRGLSYSLAIKKLCLL